MGIAVINNQTPLMKSLLGLPQLMTTSATVGDFGGKGDGTSYNISVKFELDSGKSPMSQGAEMKSSWKDSPKLSSVLNLNFKKHMRVHVIKLYGSFASPASAKYLQFIDNQDLKAFYHEFAHDKANPLIYPAGPDIETFPMYMHDMTMPVNFSHGMPNFSRGTSNIRMEANFELFHHKEEPLSFSVFLVPYIDLQGLLNDFPDLDIELLANGYNGDIKALTAGVPVYQEILRNGEVPKLSNTYVTANNDYWTGKVKKKILGDDKPSTYVGIPGDVPLTLQKVPNTLVQDLRAKEDLKKPNLLELKKMLSAPQSLLSYKDVGSESILINPKTSNFSELFLSKDVNGSARGFFIFNKEKYLFSEGAFAGLMAPKGGNISINSSLVSMTKLQTIKVYRRKVKKALSSTNEDKYIPAPNTEEQEIKMVFHGIFDENESLSTVEAHKFMIKQKDIDYDNLSPEGPKIPKFVLNQFTFYDEDVRLYSDSIFEYEVELEIMDGSYSYIKNMHDALQKNVGDMEALYAYAIRPAQPGSTPYYTAHSNMFSQTWKNGPGVDFKPLVLESMSNYLIAMGSLLAPQSYKKGNANPFGSDLKATLMKLKDKLVSFLSYDSGTIDTYELFIKMQKELLATVKSFMKLKSGAKSSFDEDKGSAGNTGAKPMINTTNHTFKNVFKTKYHLEGTVLAYDALLSSDSTVMKSILTKSGKAYQRGLLTLTEAQLRSRAEQETLRYFEETDGPITMSKDKKKIEGGDIRDNSMTYLTPSTVLMHGDIVDLSGISIVKQGTDKMSLSQKKYPKIVSELLMKKNGINKSVKKIEQALNFNLGDAGPVNASPAAAAGPGVVFDSPFGNGIPPMMQDKMKKGMADLNELKSDLSILLDSAGVSLFTKENIMPEQKKKKEKQVKNAGMGGIGAGPGKGDMAPFNPGEEPPEGSYFVAEVLTQNKIPLSLSYSLLSNLTFGTVSSGKSIEDYEDPPTFADGLNKLPTLPNQVKSLYAAQPDVNSNVKVDWNGLQKDIVNAYENVGLFYFNYELIFQIDILAGFQSHNIYKPFFVPLSDANIEGYRGKTVLCRMSRYEKLTSHKLHSKMHLPLVNEYFFLEIDPPAAPPAPPASPAEEIEEYVVNIVDIPVIPLPILQQSDEAAAMDDATPFNPGIITPIIPLGPGPGKPGGGYDL